MSQRSSALLFPIFALVSVAATDVTGPARAANDCITKPNRPAPQGEHWYYRRDQATKRPCWFLGSQGAGLQKSLMHGAKQRPSGAPAQQAAPLSAQPAAAPTPPAVAATTAAGSSNSESSISESALSLRWPEAARFPDAPHSFAPIPIATVAAVSRPSDLNTSASPASGTIAREPQWSAAAGSSQRANASAEALPQEANHTFALIMTALALLVIAGPVWHAGGWLRRREAGDRDGLEWLHDSPSDAPRARTRMPLDCHAGTMPAEPFDWSQQFAKAWQQLSEDMQTKPTRSLPA